MSSFDRDLGEQLRDAAIEQVGENAEPEWMFPALAAACLVATYRQEFTTDPIWWILDFQWEIPRPHENKAMGAVMSKLRVNRVARVIEGRISRSVRPECHRRPLQVWKSLIFKGFSARFDRVTITPEMGGVS